jgi:hypothetical protein
VALIFEAGQVHGSGFTDEPPKYLEYGAPDGLGVIREVTFMGDKLTVLEEALSEAAKHDKRIDVVEDHDEYITVKVAQYRQWSRDPFGLVQYAEALAEAREKKAAKKTTRKRTQRKVVGS